MTASISTQEERDPFTEFVKSCHEHGLCDMPAELAPEDSVEGLIDELTLRRFFNARGNDPAGAIKQLKDAVSTRQSINANATYQAIDVDLYERSRRIYPHWIGRRDKRGFPIFAFDIKMLDQTTLDEYEKTSDKPHTSTDGSISVPNQAQRAFTFHDTIVRFILPLCSAMHDRPAPGDPISSAVYLVDASTIGLKQAFSVRNYAQNVSSLLSTSFPEVLDTVYVCNVPPYFSKIWSIVKHFIDAQTAQKLVILTRDETLSRLPTVIEPENIPEQLGGTFEYEIGMLPSLDEGIRGGLQWIKSSQVTLPPGPLKWTTDNEGRRIAIAIGSLKGEPRNIPFAVLNYKQKPDVLKT